MTFSFRSVIAVTVVSLMSACNSTSSSQDADLRHHHPSDLATSSPPADMSTSGAGSGSGGNGSGVDGGSTGAAGGSVAGASLTAVDPVTAPAGARVALA